MLLDLPPDQTASYNSIVTALCERFGSDQQSEVHHIQLCNHRRGTRKPK